MNAVLGDPYFDAGLSSNSDTRLEPEGAAASQG